MRSRFLYWTSFLENNLETKKLTFGCWWDFIINVTTFCINIILYWDYNLVSLIHRGIERKVPLEDCWADQTGCVSEGASLGVACSLILHCPSFPNSILVPLPVGYCLLIISHSNVFLILLILQQQNTGIWLEEAQRLKTQHNNSTSYLDAHFHCY